MRRRITIKVNKCKVCKDRIPLDKEYCDSCDNFGIIWIEPKLVMKRP